MSAGAVPTRRLAVVVVGGSIECETISSERLKTARRTSGRFDLRVEHWLGNVVGRMSRVQRPPESLQRCSTHTHTHRAACARVARCVGVLCAWVKKN